MVLLPDLLLHESLHILLLLELLLLLLLWRTLRWIDAGQHTPFPTQKASPHEISGGREKHGFMRCETNLLATQLQLSVEGLPEAGIDAFERAGEVSAVVDLCAVL